ncbi:uncharacterized protein K452DRAFT_251529 [Aplosporella prunicola CBS 121167]|uniref:Zn(2)-C6 fungal-type domain-containing protein n=1 Tax=Aplosporella prunicola CBS 121167 TaxID=1176127 RepID=A0A6A6BC26_9PEZI|nr:uncharacterized protein K452DRAFT_251529 [Aplosporella prunicola CBS 121167]KAF2140804.1 hypothetical protein K452DRAFT_251529 [Aplosporella prunicola CBS 121167]
MSESTSAPREPAERPRPPPNRRRDKPQRSCTMCRRRKLRCDRVLPACGACSSRGLSLSCTYVTTSEPHSTSNIPGSHSARPPINERINQLESLVHSLMTSLDVAQQVNVSPPLQNSVLDPDDPDYLPDNFGHLNLDSDGPQYVGGDHWTSILDGIAELKDHLNYASSSSTQGRHQADEVESDGPELLYGLNNYANKETILAAIPPKAVADDCVANYIHVADVASNIMHFPTFLKEYERFWEDPEAVPIMWIGLLFAVIAYSMQFRQRDAPFLPSYTDHYALLDMYREKTVQCLVLGKYTNPTPFTIETLLLYFSLERLRSTDMKPGNWVLAGVIVRIAMQMGYHRDPSLTSQITPFQAEMRRRQWAIIRHMDMTSSAEVGLPKMINEAICDTAEPRNLVDSDFDEDAVELPQPRPNTELTPVLFLVARNKMFSVFGAITDLTASARRYTYKDVMQLDRTLREARLSLPSGLQLRPILNSLDEPSITVLRRISLDITFNKALCILHRKYMVAARSNEAYSYSRKSCIQGAFRILQLQVTLNQESKPEGKLHRHRRKLAALFGYDFLQAITILCFELYWRQEEAQRTPSDAEEREKIIHVLQQSYQIWMESTKTSREAQKAVEVIDIILAKADKTHQAVGGAINGVHDKPATSDDTQPDAACQNTQNSALDPAGFTPDYDFLNHRDYSFMSVPGADNSFEFATDIDLDNWGSQPGEQFFSDLFGLQLPFDDPSGSMDLTEDG